MTNVSIEAAMRRYEKGLRLLSNVTGVGISEKDGKEVIVVYVKRKLPEFALKSWEMIPDELDGYRTVVREEIKGG
jgi:hypothetical protein